MYECLFTEYVHTRWMCDMHERIHAHAFYIRWLLVDWGNTHIGFFSAWVCVYLCISMYEYVFVNMHVWKHHVHISAHKHSEHTHLTTCRFRKSLPCTVNISCGHPCTFVLLKVRSIGKFQTNEVSLPPASDANWVIPDSIPAKTCQTKKNRFIYKIFSPITALRVEINIPRVRKGCDGWFTCQSFPCWIENWQ